jgi:hypothetical protein
VYPEGALTSSVAPENASLEELDYSIKATFGGSWLSPIGPVIGTGTIEGHT